MSSENEKVMIIQNEHEIYFNGIIMKMVVDEVFNWRIIIKKEIKKKLKKKIACSKENVKRT